jgi:hypothetical protein
MLPDILGVAHCNFFAGIWFTDTITLTVNLQWSADKDKKAINGDQNPTRKKTKGKRECSALL